MFNLLVHHVTVGFKRLKCTEGDITHWLLLRLNSDKECRREGVGGGANYERSGPEYVTHVFVSLGSTLFVDCTN